MWRNPTYIQIEEGVNISLGLHMSCFSFSSSIVFKCFVKKASKWPHHRGGGSAQILGLFLIKCRCCKKHFSGMSQCFMPGYISVQRVSTYFSGSWFDIFFIFQLIFFEGCPQKTKNAKNAPRKRGAKLCIFTCVVAILRSFWQNIWRKWSWRM